MMTNSLTKAEVSAVANEAADKAVRNVFVALGVDVNDQKSLNEFRGAITWALRYSKLSGQVGSRVILTLATLAAIGSGAGILSYFKSSIH